MNSNIFIKAAATKDIVEFLQLIFPEEWQPVASRIIETGVEFDKGMCNWAPRWSKIPFTVKTGRTELEAAVKSVMYRVHDCFHQLWGLPIPSTDFTTDDFYSFKRAQMCGEVAVLSLSEFILAKKLYDKYPDIRDILDRRCAISMMEGPFKYKSPIDIAMRMDDILHKKNRPKWLREHKDSGRFADYYVPMLEADRIAIDHNWKCMKKANWIPIGAPNSRYSPTLDGLELTIWMVTDFYHLTKTDTEIDMALTNFNRDRRSEIKFPEGWGKG
jgi:hypothetical protein